jgi:hypothetical protein
LASEEEKYSFVMDIAAGKLKTEHIGKWLQQYIIPKKHP